MNRLEFIFKAVNAIASRKHDAMIEYMLAQAVLHEINTASRERRANTAPIGGSLAMLQTSTQPATVGWNDSK